MNLQNLLRDEAGRVPSVVIHGMALHTTQVKKGTLFIALPGKSQKGTSFIPEAVARGAVAVAYDATLSFQGPETVPVFPIVDLAQKVRLWMKAFYGPIRSEVGIIGVTGTNGKTTVCHLLTNAFETLCIPSGIIGTLGWGMAPTRSESALTTPDCVSLYHYITHMQAQGAKKIVMEVSSHGLAERRVDDLPFKGAVFTNLTPDHLDYHGTMSEYGRAKARLFQFPDLRYGVINAEMPYAETLLKGIAKDKSVVLYTTQKKRPFSIPSTWEWVTLDTALCDRQGVRATVSTPWGKGVLQSSLLGDWNVSNQLAALSVLGMEGIPLPSMLQALAQSNAPEGRMQRVARSPDVFVDYAHTPDALEKVLSTLRSYCQGKLWCIFGCGGDRDPHKRQTMGAVSVQYADRVVLTNDNPRTEDPFAIIQMIQEGTHAFPEKVTVIEDRREAIRVALQEAHVDDMLLIAGKGHELYQIIGEKRVPFQDALCVTQLLSQKSA